MEPHNSDPTRLFFFGDPHFFDPQRRILKHSNRWRINRRIQFAFEARFLGRAAGFVCIVLFLLTALNRRTIKKGRGLSELLQQH